MRYLIYTNIFVYMLSDPDFFNEAQGHKDPSDHVIIAHAMTEHLPLISSDTRFEFHRKQGLDLIFNRK